jgi:hypothetical protein
MGRRRRVRKPRWGLWHDLSPGERRRYIDLLCNPVAMTCQQITSLRVSAEHSSPTVQGHQSAAAETGCSTETPRGGSR